MNECLYVCVIVQERVRVPEGVEGEGSEAGRGLTVNRRAGKYFMNKAFKSEQEQLVSTVRLLGPPRPD